MRKRFRRPSPALAISLIALFVAMGGTSYGLARNSIDSRELKNNDVRSSDIRNNDVRSKDVRNGSLLAGDFKSGQLPAGPRGATGPGGPRGFQGVPGPRGVVTPQTASDPSENIAGNGGSTTILQKVVPAGSYVVTAKFTLFASDADQTDCSLRNAGAEVDGTSVTNTPAANRNTPASLAAVVNVGAGPLTITCGKSNPAGGSAADIKLIAIPVG